MVATPSVEDGTLRRDSPGVAHAHDHAPRVHGLRSLARDRTRRPARVRHPHPHDQATGIAPFPWNQRPDCRDLGFAGEERIADLGVSGLARQRHADQRDQRDDTYRGLQPDRSPHARRSLPGSMTARSRPPRQVQATHADTPHCEIRHARAAELLRGRGRGRMAVSARRTATPVGTVGRRWCPPCHRRRSEPRRCASPGCRRRSHAPRRRRRPATDRLRPLASPPAGQKFPVFESGFSPRDRDRARNSSFSSATE